MSLAPGKRIAPPAASTNGATKPPGRVQRALASMLVPSTEGPEPAIIVCAGPPGVGKTTFAFGAPAPFFVLLDRGGNRAIPRSFKHVARPVTWDDASGAEVSIMGVLRALLTDEHDRQTVVIDTINRAESLLWAWICARHKVESIELVENGYGKGFTRALEKWHELIGLCFELREQRGMNVILLSHQVARTAPSPTGDEYEKWQLQLNEKAAGALVAAADTTIFAEPEVAAKLQGTGFNAKKKGGATGIIKAHVRPRQGIDAKNRDFLPPEMLFSWAIYAQEAERGAALKERLFAHLATLDGGQRAEVDTYLATWGWSRSAVEQVLSAAGGAIEAPKDQTDTETDNPNTDTETKGQE